MCLFLIVSLRSAILEMRHRRCDFRYSVGFLSKFEAKNLLKNGIKLKFEQKNFERQIT